MQIRVKIIVEFFLLIKICLMERIKIRKANAYGRMSIFHFYLSYMLDIIINLKFFGELLLYFLISNHKQLQYTFFNSPILINSLLEPSSDQILFFLLNILEFFFFFSVFLLANYFVKFNQVSFLLVSDWWA